MQHFYCSGKSEVPMCQLSELNRMGEEFPLFKRGLHFGMRGVRFLRNRIVLFHYALTKRKNKRSKSAVGPAAENLKPGDRVRIKSREEISKTLDGWKRYKGCRFMDEMWKYCSSTHTVFKRVNQMLDERTMRMKRCTNVYILDGLVCDGSWPFTKCDRSCFYFWRSEWLEKLE